MILISDEMELYEMQGLMETSWTVHCWIICQVSRWLCFVLVNSVQVSMVDIVFFTSPDYRQIYINISFTYFQVTLPSACGDLA